MNKFLSSIIAVAVTGATFGAFAQPTRNSDETTLEQSTTVRVPKDGVRVDEKKTTTTTTARPVPPVESTSTTTTTERKAAGDTTVEVKAKTKTETEKSY
jgi:hypothetical protein